MNAQQIVESLKTRKGQHVQAVWQRLAKTLKACPMAVGKRTSAWVRAGIDYANLASVQNGIASGERGEVQSLPWGTWKQFPFVIENKGKEYVRLYPASFGNLSTPQVEWTLDGKPTTYENVEQFLLESEKRKDNERPDCFTLSADSILSIGE